MLQMQRLDRSCSMTRPALKCSMPAVSRPQLRVCSRRQIAASAIVKEVGRTSVSFGQRVMLGVTGVAAALLLGSAPPSLAAEPFLTATGARGPLVEQEQALYNLRVQKEGEMRREIQQQREVMEAEARSTQGGKLCATPFGIDIVGVTIFVALIGAGVGGYTARQRKEEAERLNEQLRKINAQLRKQARAATAGGASSQVYAPGSVNNSGSGSGSGSNGRSYPQPTLTATITLPKPVVTTSSPAAAAASAAAAAAPAAVTTLMSMDEDEMSLEQLECRDTLRAGKKLLKSGKGAAAQTNFETALILSRRLGDKVQERRATRGLAAAAKMQREFPVAISQYERVLQISKEMGEYTGDADAYGSIADCYTEMDRFDKAAEYYDLYIQHMED